MDAVILPPERPGTTVRRFPWWIPFGIGILVIAAGVGLLVWPFIAASWLLVIFFGSALIAGGLAALVRQRASGASVIGGIVLIAAGILSILFSEFTAGALITFVGVSLIAVGALWLVMVLSFGVRSVVAVLPAVLLIVAGVIGLVWPEVALVLAAITAGVCALAVGGVIVGGSLTLRRVRITETIGRV